MRNICRPFTLYSDFLPPAKTSRDWKYLAYGYFDGVNIGDNLLEDGIWNFEKMWLYLESEKLHLDGSYTEQTIFGFRTEEDSCEEDMQFWKNIESDKYPFLFLILIQDEVNGGNLNGLCYNRRRLERDLSANKGVCAISYLTLDSSDLLLVLACEEYSAGTKLIDSFHTGDGSSVLSQNGWNLYYSYTIPAIRKSFLNNSDKIAGLNGILDSAYIHIIEKYPGGIKEVYNVINDKWSGEATGIKTEKKAVLGCNDELIIMKGIPWSLFLSFYQDETGALNHSSSIYQKNIIGVTTILGEEGKERGVRERDGGSGGDKAVTVSESLRKECQVLRLDNESGRGRMVRKEILSVLNSLEKYEKSSFHDYIFVSALRPMKMLVTMVKEADKREDEDKYGYFYDFLTSFNMYAQNSMRSDRQFTEVPDFNIRIYETPAKMNAFYNAVIYNLKSLLNELGASEKKRHEYEFLTCPGVANNMQVREIYPELIEDKRLFLVDMPEKQVYSPWLMFVMMAHEVSHFVGRGIRQRDFRYECLVRMVSEVVVRYLYEKLAGYFGDEEHFNEITHLEGGGSYWEALENEIVQQLESYMEWEDNDKFIEKRFNRKSLDREKGREYWKKRIHQYGYHSDMLKKLMLEHLCWICEEQKIYAYLPNREFIYQLSKGKSGEQARGDGERLENSLEKWLLEFCRVSEWNLSDWGAYAVIDKLMYLLKECFADLGAVMLLDLSMEEYLKSILLGAYDQGIGLETLIGQTEGLVRGALVCLCMISNEDDCPQKWSFDEVIEISEQEGDISVLASVLWEKMRIYGENYKKELWEVQEKEEIIYHSSVLEKALQYLVKCRKNFSSQMEGNMGVMQKEILEMFHAFSKENVETIILDIRKYIDTYQQKLEDDLDKCKRDR